MGCRARLNAWLPAAVLGVKVIDAVGDVRAHPTGDMGSIGLAGRPEPTIQTVAGGNRARNSYIEATFRGATGKVSPVCALRRMLRVDSLRVAATRFLPVIVRQHAALGGISIALELGQAITDAEPRGAQAVLECHLRAS